MLIKPRVLTEAHVFLSAWLTIWWVEGDDGSKKLTIQGPPLLALIWFCGDAQFKWFTSNTSISTHPTIPSSTNKMHKTRPALEPLCACSQWIYPRASDSNWICHPSSNEELLRLENSIWISSWSSGESGCYSFALRYSFWVPAKLFERAIWWSRNEMCPPNSGTDG